MISDVIYALSLHFLSYSYIVYIKALIWSGHPPLYACISSYVAPPMKCSIPAGVSLFAFTSWWYAIAVIVSMLLQLPEYSDLMSCSVPSLTVIVCIASFHDMFQAIYPAWSSSHQARPWPIMLTMYWYHLLHMMICYAPSSVQMIPCAPGPTCPTGLSMTNYVYHVHAPSNVQIIPCAPGPTGLSMTNYVYHVHSPSNVQMIP